MYTQRQHNKVRSLHSDRFFRSSLSYIIFVVGTALVIIAWLESYPISTPPLGKHLIDDVSPLFWPGLSLILVSLALIARSKSKRTRFLCAITFVFFLYFHYFLFQLLPGPDAHSFRALTKLYSTVGPDPTEQSYFQWPSFFVLGNVLVNVLGIGVDSVSVVVFLATGFLLSSTLFFFFSVEDERLDFTSVSLYFTGLFWFLNYQFAPQSLALGLFFLLVNFASKRSAAVEIASLVVFISLVLMHAFIPALFLLYYLILTVRDPRRMNLLLSFSAIYAIMLAYFAVHFGWQLLGILLGFYSLGGEYAGILQGTFRGPVAFLDDIAQFFSRGITLFIWSILLVGFLGKIIKREITINNLSLLLTGLIHFLGGVVLSILGSRGLQVLFVPFVSGYRFFVDRSAKIMYICILLIFLLFPFVVLHQIYDTTSAQTASGERASEMLIRTLDTRLSGVDILSNDRDGDYVFKMLPSSRQIWIETSFTVSKERMLTHRYDYIFYGPMLEKEALYNYNLDNAQVMAFRLHFISKCNKLYDDGYTSVLSYY